MNNFYKYKIGWCYFCSQGWAEIVKDLVLSELYILCDECNLEWNTPIDFLNKNSRYRLNNNPIIDPTDEDVEIYNWTKFIVEN